MLFNTDPVDHGVCGLTGVIHNNYRSEITRKQELGGGLRRIYLRLVDDVAKPEGVRRRPTLESSVIVPSNQQYHHAYRTELWNRIENGGSLTDITIH